MSANTEKGFNLIDLNGSGIPTGGSRLVQSSLLQHATTTPPVTQSPVGTPIGSGVSCKLHATVKKDPLVIKLKGKGRKPSQPPHLGVQSSRPHRIKPVSSFPGHRNRPPVPRLTSTPSERLEQVESAVSIAAQLPQPTSPNPRIRSPHHSSYNPHPPRSTSTPSGRLEEVESPVSTAAQSPWPTNPNPVSGRPGAGATVVAFPPQPRPMASHNPLPGSAGATTTDVLARIISPPGSQPPQPALDPNAAPYNLAAFPPSHTSPPPPVTNVLRPPGADGTVPEALPVPDRRYVPASALRDEDELSEGSMDLTTPQLQAAAQIIYSSMITDVAQRSSSPVNSAHNASSSHTAHTASPRRYVPALRDEDEPSKGSMYLTTPQPQAAVQNPSMIMDADYVAETFSSLVNSAHNASSRRHVPAITLRDEDEFSEASMDLTIYPQSEAVQRPGRTVDADHVAHRCSSPVNSAHTASASHTAHTASSSHTVDILALPIEGWARGRGIRPWEVHGAEEFDAFAAGISDGVPSPEQGPTSLNDVLQQMAGDDYLWEQFPGW